MNRLKKLNNLIKKIATKNKEEIYLPPVPGDEEPVVKKSPLWQSPSSLVGNLPPGTINTEKRFVTYSNPDVKKMQTAILNFADIASKTDVTALKGNQEGQIQGEQSRAIKPISTEVDDPNLKLNEQVMYMNTYDDKEYLGGSDPFGNFIINNYIPKDSYTGKQYLNVDIAGNKSRELASMTPQSLRGIIDSMKRVGTPGSSGTEKSIDGIWKTRTNNALHVISDLVQAMLNFINDMKKPVKGYSQQELDQYKKLVPNSYTDLKQNEISNIAKELTTHIEKMTVFFQNLIPSVFLNTQLRQYIDQKASFSKYTVLPDDDKLFNRNISVNISGKQINISLNDLKNKDSFKKLINNYFGQLDPATEKNTLKYVLTELKKQLDTQSELANERK